MRIIAEQGNLFSGCHLVSSEWRGWASSVWQVQGINRTQPQTQLKFTGMRQKCCVWMYVCVCVRVWHLFRYHQSDTSASGVSSIRGGDVLRDRMPISSDYMPLCSGGYTRVYTLYPLICQSEVGAPTIQSPLFFRRMVRAWPAPYCPLTSESSGWLDWS